MQPFRLEPPQLAITRIFSLFAFSIVVLLATPHDVRAQQFMTKDELLAAIPGNQLSGISNQDGKTPWVQAYSKATKKNTGIYNGIWNRKDKYSGEWFVKGDQWCEKGDWGQQCWSLERVRAKEFRIYKDGKPLKKTWKLK